MAYDKVLSDRIRDLLLGRLDFTERRMFGGLVFLVGGAALWVNTRRRARGASEGTTSLTPDEEAKLAALMSGEAPNKP